MTAGAFPPQAYYWQFVVWGRQLLLCGITLVPKYLAPEYTAESMESLIAAFGAANSSINATDAGPASVVITPGQLRLAYIQASISVIIFAVALVLQLAVKPFAFAFQNRIEAILLLADIATIILGIWYTYRQTSTNELSAGLEAMIILALFGSIIATFGYMALRKYKALRRRKLAYLLGSAAAAEDSLSEYSVQRVDGEVMRAKEAAALAAEGTPLPNRRESTPDLEEDLRWLRDRAASQIAATRDGAATRLRGYANAVMPTLNATRDRTISVLHAVRERTLTPAPPAPPPAGAPARSVADHSRV